MLEFSRRGFAISGAAGLLTGLFCAWGIWHEVPTPNDPTQVAANGQVPTAPPVSAAPEAPVTEAEGMAPEAPARTTLPAELIDLKQTVVENGLLVQDLGDGRRIEYTVLPEVQKRAMQVLEKADVPFGAMVAIEPSTGRILGFAEHSARRPDLKHVATLANPPAASVFKVVTTAALIEHVRLAPDYEVCFHGGSSGFKLEQLEDNSRLDTSCQTLNEALARSTNVIFGKLADRFLDAQALEAYAGAFGWNKEIPFVLDVQPSDAVFSNDRLRLSRTAAGFYNTQLSPVHAAVFAGTIANDGVMMAPKLVERYTVDGAPVLTRTSRPLGRSIRSKTARVLGNMMVATTELGTARPYFSKRDKSLKGIRVAGKTGSLSAKGDDGERHHFSWWIGFAPAENPRIAVAALVVNVGKWKIKSTYLARETLEAYFAATAGDDVTSR